MPPTESPAARKSPDDIRSTPRPVEPRPGNLPKPDVESKSPGETPYERFMRENPKSTHVRPEDVSERIDPQTGERKTVIKVRARNPEPIPGSDIPPTNENGIK